MLCQRNSLSTIVLGSKSAGHRARVRLPRHGKLSNRQARWQNSVRYRPLLPAWPVLRSHLSNLRPLCRARCGHARPSPAGTAVAVAHAGRRRCIGGVTGVAAGGAPLRRAGALTAPRGEVAARTCIPPRRVMGREQYVGMSSLKRTRLLTDCRGALPV